MAPYRSTEDRNPAVISRNRSALKSQVPLLLGITSIHLIENHKDKDEMKCMYIHLMAE